MTALKKYDRLEAEGLWRETHQAQKRPVIVSFGNASLIIRDRTDAALTHWSLPAIERVNPGKYPAIFRPSPDAGEELEIEDAMLVDALEKVRRTIDKHRSRSGRLRLYIFLILLSSIIALAATWLPSALIHHTISVVPSSQRQVIGTKLLQHLSPLTGGICASKAGTIALSELNSRVLNDKINKTHILRASPPEHALVLPGQIILIDRSVVEDHDTPAVLAGYMIAGYAVMQTEDPLEKLLKTAGFKATFQLLTTGELSDRILRSYAQSLLVSAPALISQEELVQHFKSAQVASSPYAYALDVSGETTLRIIENDPYRNEEITDLISDRSWINLQNICFE